MIFLRTKVFNRNFKKLTPHLQELAKIHFKLFKQNPNFPDPSLKIKPMQGYSGIWEGHVTNECVFTFHKDKDKKTGETMIIFRKIGTHDIYKNP
jgi:mRNA-degrading endonuclease YafQ of YafQ-DinJ toxin-antitoxin module